jgi:hypothetical protein
VNTTTMVALAANNEPVPIQYLYQEDFSSYQLGTAISSIKGWYMYDQSGGGASANVALSSPLSGHSAQIQPASGFWDSIQYFGQTFGDVDFSCWVALPPSEAMIFHVRTQNITWWLPDSYYLFVTALGAWSIGKACGSNTYNLLSGNAGYSVGKTQIRIVVKGLVVTGYLNGNLLGSHDFTGDGLCSSAAYPTGGLGFTCPSSGIPYQISDIKVLSA